MVEENHRTPTPLVVTVFTFLSFLSLMLIIVLMTGIAGHPQLLFGKRPCVALVTINLAMFLFEGKLGLVVVENGTFPLF